MAAARRIARGIAAGLALAVGAVLAVAILAGALVLALASGWQRDALRERLERELGARLGASVRIERLEGRLLDGVSASGIAIEAPGGAALRAERVEVAWRLAPLLAERRLAVSDLRLAGVRLEAVRVEEGWRVSGLAEPIGTGEPEAPREPPPLSVEIGALAIEDAVVAVRDEAGALPTRASGRLDATARGVRWPVAGPEDLPAALAAALALAPSIVAGREVASGRLSIEGGARTWRLADASLAGPFGRLGASGTATLAANGGFALEATEGRLVADGLDLAPLARDPRLATRLDGTATLALPPPGAGGDPRLDVQLALAGAAVGDVAIGSVRASGWLEPDTQAWRLDEARVEGALGRLRAEAAGTAASLASASVTAQGLALGRLPPEWVGGERLGGRADLEARLEGPWRTPRGVVELRAEELARGGLGPATLALAAEAFGDGRLRIERLALRAPQGELALAEPARLRVAVPETGAPSVAIESLVLRGAGARVAARGALEAGTWRALRLDVDVPDLAATARAVGAEPPAEGALRGEVVAEGPLARPSLRGALALTDVVARGARVARVAIELAPDGARQRALVRIVDRGRERLAARIAVAREALFTEPGALLRRGDSEATVTADALDLAWLSAALGRAAPPLEGSLDVALAVRGAAPQPRLDGRVALDDASLEIEALREPIDGIEAELRFAGDRAELVRLLVPGGTGAIRGRGAAALSAAGLGAVDVELEADTYPLPAGLPLTGALDGALRIVGDAPALHVGGELRLVDAEVALGSQSDPLWKEIRVRGLPGEEVEAGIREGELELPPALAPLSANVRLVVPEGTHVQGLGADLRIAGDVRVQKAAGEPPIYTGALQVLEGRFAYRGRRFELERGSLTFAGTRELDPELDLVARYDVDDVTLRIVASGRASAPTLTLESDPPLDPADQLSYLAFGRPASGLGASDAERLQAAATLVLAEAFGGVGEGIASRLPVDEIGFTAGDEGGAGVEVARRLGRTVTLRYVRDLGVAGDRLRIEWRFHRFGSLEAELGTESSAVDVIGVYDY